MIVQQTQDTMTLNDDSKQTFHCPADEIREYEPSFPALPQGMALRRWDEERGYLSTGSTQTGDPEYRYTRLVEYCGKIEQYQAAYDLAHPPAAPEYPTLHLSLTATRQGRTVQLSGALTDADSEIIDVSLTYPLPLLRGYWTAQALTPTESLPLSLTFIQGEIRPQEYTLAQDGDYLIRDDVFPLLTIDGLSYQVVLAGDDISFIVAADPSRYQIDRSRLLDAHYYTLLQS